MATTLTTIGWLVQGLLRGDKVYAYARSLGSGEPNRAKPTFEGTDAAVTSAGMILSMPACLCCRLPSTQRLPRAAGSAAGFTVCSTLPSSLLVGLSQYTYAILFAVAITAMELLAALLRVIFRKLSTGASLLWTVPFFAAIWLLRVPLISWAGNLAAGLGFENATYSLAQLLTMLMGGAVDSGSRLITYTTPLAGIAASPLTGALLNGVKVLGMHSDLLDLLSGMGILGTAAFGLGAWVIGRGSQKGIRHSPAFAQVVLQYVALFLCMALGTVFYSREIPLLLCLTGALLLREKPADSTQAS